MLVALFVLHFGSNLETDTHQIGICVLSTLLLLSLWFLQFTQRMVQQYMREEELRSKHQSTLLKLRGHALRDKTQAELEWLQLKKKQLRNKGADDLMPPLVKRERDLFRKLQHEQAEIHHLKEAQKAASQERRLMLLQQAEISKIRRSAQYYREKIHRYSSQQKRDVSPSSDRDLFSPSPSLDDTREVSIERHFIRIITNQL